MPYMTMKQFTNEISSPTRFIKRYDWCTCRWLGLDEVLRYRMYQTDIVTVHKNVLILDVGTWYTRTTKDKLNEILALYIPSAYIRQDKGSWYYTSTGVTIPFFNGMKIKTQTGKVLNASKAPKKSKEKDKLKKLIDRYCTKLSKRVTLPYPASGDCWVCKMFDNGDNEHLLAHLREGYIHGSLILRALKARGYVDPYFIFELGRTKNSSTRSAIINAVRNYLKDALGIPR